jgi:uncharacterized protein (DUF736 family)
MKIPKTSTSQSNSEQKSNAGGNTIPDFKLYYRVITIKTTWYWHKNRQEDQWIRIEDPDINLCIYSQLVFDKGAQKTQWRKEEKTVSSTNAVGKTVYPHAED